jgi:hypothetical protein
MKAVLAFVLLLAGQPAGGQQKAPEPPAVPPSDSASPPRIFTPQAIDRALHRLDLREERMQFLALHPESPLPGMLPRYAAVITVKDQARKLEPDIEEYKTLPGFGLGGRQGLAYDPYTGIPWWF